MLSDVIKKYGGEKMGSMMYIKIFLELEKDLFRKSMKIVEVFKQI